MSENGKIYTAGKNLTLLPAVTAVTNSTSAEEACVFFTYPGEKVACKSIHLISNKGVPHS